MHSLTTLFALMQRWHSHPIRNQQFALAVGIDVREEFQFHSNFVSSTLLSFGRVVNIILNTIMITSNRMA